MSFEIATEVVRQLRHAGFEAVFAGGCVRDSLLGRQSKDIDIATSASPDEVEDLFDHTHAVGKAFGVILVVWGDCAFDVATFRQDLAYLDGRHPTGITASTPREDAQRRDFTINGLFLDPLEDRVIDYVGGQADLQAGIVRAIGQPMDRFAEDHLRMLRAVRFAASLNFEIESGTLDAIRTRAHDLRAISRERIREEFVRTLTESDRPGDALELLANSGLLEHVLPEALKLKGCEQPPEFHPEGDVWTHTVMMLNGLGRGADPELALGVLLHDIGKPATYEEALLEDGSVRIRFQGHAQVGADMARSWLSDYKFSKAQRNAVVQLVDRHMNMMNVRHMRKASLRKLVGNPLFEWELALHKLDCACSNGITESAEILEREREKWLHQQSLPEAWIDGRDLLNLGLQAGPEIGRWKQAAYDAQLETRFASKDELLLWLSEAIFLPE